MSIEMKSGEKYEDYVKRVEATLDLKRRFEREDESKKRQEASTQPAQPIHPTPIDLPSSDTLKYLIHFAERKLGFNAVEERILIENEKRKFEDEIKRNAEAAAEASKKALEKIQRIFYERFLPVLEGKIVDWNTRLPCGHSVIKTWMDRCGPLDREFETVASKVMSNPNLSDVEILNLLVMEIKSEVRLICDFFDYGNNNPDDRLCSAEYVLRVIPKL